MAKRRFRSRGRFTRVRRSRRGGARRLKKFVKRVVRRMSEVKYSVATDREARDVRIGYWENVTPLIPQGADKDQRIGWKVRYKYLQFRCNIRLNASGNPSTLYPDAAVRVILWQARLNYAIPVYNATGFGSYTPTIGSLALWNSNTVPYISSINANFARIIMDRTYTLGNGTVTGMQTNLKNGVTIKKKVRVNNNVNFPNATTFLPQDPKDNYYITIVSGTSANTTDPPTGTNRIDVEWHTRLSFIDI